MQEGAMTPPLLSIDAIVKRFGGVIALDGVSFNVSPTTITGLIGPNGSGKTTLLNVINGVFKPDSGTVRLGTADILGKRPSELAAMGIARTFQTARVFQTLTTLQNLSIPLLHHGSSERAVAGRRAQELLAFVGLDGLASHPASALSGGQQRLLEFARALVTEPSLVLMDEPFAGVHPEIKRRIIDCIKAAVVRDRTSFIIVSHEVSDLVAMSDIMLCLVGGRVAAEGMPAAVVRDPKVVEGYLGGVEDGA
jgi:ABC-type branched-subunit amino acid transport system ATPase component